MGDNQQNIYEDELPIKVVGDSTCEAWKNFVVHVCPLPEGVKTYTYDGDYFKDGNPKTVNYKLRYEKVDCASNTLSSQLLSQFCGKGRCYDPAYTTKGSCNDTWEYGKCWDDTVNRKEMCEKTWDPQARRLITYPLFMDSGGNVCTTGTGTDYQDRILDKMGNGLSCK